MLRDRRRSSRATGVVLTIVALALVIVILQGLFRAGGSPDIEIEPATSVIGRQTPVKIKVSEPRRGLTHVKVELCQDDKTAIIEDRSYPPSSQFNPWSEKTDEDILQVEVGSRKMPGLTGGSATIRVTADRAVTWLRRPDPEIYEVKLPVQLTPPSLQITSIQTYVSQGGCEAVVYHVGETAVRDGVRSGSYWFPGYPLPGGGKQDRFALFAIPYDMAQPEARLIAEDAAGNRSETGFIDKFFAKPPKNDTISVTDSFMSKVVPEILSQSPEIEDQGSLLDNYLAINRQLRRSNDETLKTLAKKSKPEFLWHKPFLMMRNAKVMSGFADQRTYRYQGRIVDHQVHLGYDLAITKQAPVPAANNGIVVYAAYFGIYGNAVVIDHGYGLQSIYGHLSSISVTEGEEVERGHIIGKTGETGLAGGDHLHFCTLLQGVPVNPVEWWDGHWIRDRIARKLGSAFQFAE